MSDQPTIAGPSILELKREELGNVGMLILYQKIQHVFMGKMHKNQVTRWTR
jgi:hypothetical protein